jgi:virulence-associated protein VagC
VSRGILRNSVILSDAETVAEENMKTKVTEKGVLIPRKFFKGVREVEIRKEENVVMIVPLNDDPIRRLGERPVEGDIEDASENHDRYLYALPAPLHSTL